MTRKSTDAPSTTTSEFRPLVLVVDDYEDNRELYSEYLASSGFDVLLAADGQEALEKAFESPPDVIVIDLSLPVIDGSEAIRRLKENERTKDIPIIVLTGHTLVGHSKEAMDAGCDSFLAKPCLPQTLTSTVREMLAERRSAG